MRTASHLATLLLPLCLGQGVAAQTWNLIASGGPSARGHTALAYDRVRDRVVLFGGLATTWVGDTWELEADGWRRCAVGGPSARHSHAMVYDERRKRIVLFGGYGGTWFDDTWEYDGRSWRTRAAPGPAPREGHAMVYDSLRSRAVLYGGWNGREAFGDLWEFDGNAWQRRPEKSPGPRVGHAMAFDALRGTTVLFGGTDGVDQCGDTWEWNGTRWRGHDSGMRARSHHAMTFDPVREVVVMVGGGGGANETWEWNGLRWTKTAAAPGHRIAHAATYDIKRKAPVLFGGMEVINRLGDTWVYSPYASAAAHSYGAGCGEPGIVLVQGDDSRPIVGRRAYLDVLGAPDAPTYIAIGTRDGSGPLTPLPVRDMPQCHLLQSVHVMAQAQPPIGGAAALTTSVPNAPALLGLRISLQSWAFAPGCTPDAVVVSNGVEWLVGTL
jgi:hypothetical protein